MPDDENGFFYAETNPAREKQKREYIAMPEAQAASLNIPEQYQRMRYLREVEAHAFVRRVQAEAARNREKKENDQKQLTYTKKEWKGEKRYKD